MPVPRDPALDGLRGLTIVVMILSSYSGNVRYDYPLLAPTLGCGWSLADLVVPIFLWAIGLSLACSVARRRSAGQASARLLAHGAKRSVALFAIGLALGAMPCIDAPSLLTCLSEPRLFGIFERIAVAYAIAVPLVLWLSPRRLVAVVVVAMVSYQFLYIGTDFMANCDPSLRRTADTSLPAACYVVAGYVTQSFFSRYAARRVVALAAGGALLVVTAFAVAAVIPFGHERLDLSFFLFSTGMGALVLALLTSMSGNQLALKLMSPTRVLGANPLALYIFAAVVFQIGHAVGVHGSSGEWLPVWTAAWQALADATGSPQLGSLAMGALLVAMTTCLAYLLSWRGIVIKL